MLATLFGYYAGHRRNVGDSGVFCFCIKQCIMRGGYAMYKISYRLRGMRDNFHQFCIEEKIHNKHIVKAKIQWGTTYETA